MEGLVAAAKAEGSAIVPICSYAVAWLRRNPELAAGVTE
jgi:predicted GNAT family acetyltransferase